MLKRLKRPTQSIVDCKCDIGHDMILKHDIKDLQNSYLIKYTKKVYCDGCNAIVDLS